MNNLGDFIFRANLSNLPAGENVAILRNRVNSADPDQVFFRLGSMAPGLSETVTSFGTGPSARINDAGEIIWFATLSGNAATDQALFANDTLLHAQRRDDGGRRPHHHHRRHHGYRWHFARFYQQPKRPFHSQPLRAQRRHAGGGPPPEAVDTGSAQRRFQKNPWLGG